jgi:hypothetical protein
MGHPTFERNATDQRRKTVAGAGIRLSNGLSETPCFILGVDRKGQTPSILLKYAEVELSWRNQREPC